MALGMNGPLQIYMIAGPNGAGKTTFAREFLPNEASCPVFVNADLIAAGLSPFAPEAAAMDAGRVMLAQIASHVRRRESFGIETTLSGKAYARHIPSWRADRYEVNLLFLRLPDSEAAIARVRQRVREGGHDVPEAVIRRRFEAGLRNFEHVIKTLVDRWALYDNSGNAPMLLDEGGRSMKVKEPEPAERRPIDPLLRAADTALRRAAIKAQERARATGSNPKPHDSRQC